MRSGGSVAKPNQAFAPVSINPFANCTQANACGLRNGLRRLPALDLPYDSLSTVSRQAGILMYVHPILRESLTLRQPQSSRPGSDGRPMESSHLEPSCDHSRALTELKAATVTATEAVTGNNAPWMPRSFWGHELRPRSITLALKRRAPCSLAIARVPGFKATPLPTFTPSRLPAPLIAAKQPRRALYGECNDRQERASNRADLPTLWALM
jgi:hypothetical protein